MLILKIKVIKTDREKQKEKVADVFPVQKPKLVIRVREVSHLRLPENFPRL